MRMSSFVTIKLMSRAIRRKDMKLLQSQVSASKDALEERNHVGLTPLYDAVFTKWPQGALFLLEQGADVKASELPPQCLRHSHQPLVHLAVATRSERLVKELIKRGADIRVRDWEDQDCVDSVPEVKNEVFAWMAEAVAEQGSRRPNLEKDLLFLAHIGTLSNLKAKVIQPFIAKQASCHQKKMLQIFAACTYTRNFFNSSNFWLMWKMSMERSPCRLHDHTDEEETAPRSVFADILQVKEPSQSDTESEYDESLTARIQALFAIEKYMPEDNLLTSAVQEISGRLLKKGKVVTAIEILWRHTQIRAPCMKEMFRLINRLTDALKVLSDTSEIPFEALPAALKTIDASLASLPAGTSPGQRIDCPDGKKFYLKQAFDRLFQNLLQIINMYLSGKVCASQEQLDSLSALTKTLVCKFPHCHDWNFFLSLLNSGPDYSDNASLIKTLVGFSANALGKHRLKNSPPHLFTDVNGDTPLHHLARSKTRKFLVKEEVLKCFLENGADLCTRNYQGESIRSILVRRGVCTEGELLPSLQCLAAASFMGDDRLRRTVRNCRPAKIKDFLLDH